MNAEAGRLIEVDWGPFDPWHAVMDGLLPAGFGSTIDSRAWLRRSLGKCPSTDGAAYAIAT